VGTLVAARSGDGWRALAHPVDAWRGALLGSITLADVPTRVLRGSSVTLTVRAEGRRTVTLRRRSTGNAWVETPLALTVGAVTTELGPLDADVTLVASDGRATSDTAVIRVVDRPFLGDVSVRMTFPGYLKRAPETVPADALLRLPAGTTLDIQGYASEPLAAVTLSRGRDTLRLAPDGRRFSGRFVPGESGSWEWSARGLTTQIADVPPPLSVEVVPDSAPVAEILAPMADSLVEPDGKVAVELLASDDHALESVVLRMSRVDAAGRVDAPTMLPLGGAGLADWAGSLTLDLARFRLGVGEAVRLQLVAFDASPRRMQGASREVTLKVPATEEQRLAARAAADSAAARVAALSKAVAELQQRTEQAASQRAAQDGKAAGQRPMEFEKAQQAQALAQQQKEMAQRVQQMSQAARDIEKRLRDAGALDTSLARQLQQAQDLMRQALTPEMLEALRKLDNSSQQLAGEQARQSLAELAEQQKRMREALEKSAEILKRAALEGAMQTLRDEANELAKQQRARGDSGQRATTDELKRLEQRTQQLSRDLESLRDRLEKARADTAAKQASAALDEAQRAARALDQALQNRGEQPGQQAQQGQPQQMGAQGQQGGAQQQSGQPRQGGQQGQQQGSAQGQQQAGAQGQQQAGGQGQPQAGAQGQQSGGGQPQQGGQPQRGQGTGGADQAADALQRAAQALAEGRKAQVEEWKNEVTGEIDRSLQEMLQLARQQDDLAAKARRDPNAPTLRSEQGAIEQGVQKAAERLADEARRSALVSQGSQRAMAEAQQRVSQAAREAGDPRTMAQAPGSMADAAVALRLVASALARDRERANTSQSASGLPELLAQLQQLAQQQGGLNGQMQSLLQLAQQQARAGEGLGDVREQARQLSRAQRQVAQQLAEVGDADQSGRAAELAREARQLAQALEQGAIDPAVLERQQRLFRRMLDAGRTLENDRQDESAKRESRPGDQSNPFLPPNGPAAGRAALKYRVPDWSELRGLSPEERRLVIDYFRRLNGGDRP